MALHHKRFGVVFPPLPRTATLSFGRPDRRVYITRKSRVDVALSCFRVVLYASSVYRPCALRHASPNTEPSAAPTPPPIHTPSHAATSTPTARACKKVRLSIAAAAQQQLHKGKARTSVCVPGSVRAAQA